MKIIDSMTISISELIRRDFLNGQASLKYGIHTVGGGLKEDWRGEVSKSLGKRLSNSIRSKTYQNNRAGEKAPAAIVYSTAPEILETHDKGSIIQGKNGNFLAIPTAAAGKGRGGKRLTIGEWEKKTGQRLSFIPGDGGTWLAVAKGMRVSKYGVAKTSRSKKRDNLPLVPIFILKRRIKLSKRISLDPYVKKWEDRIIEIALSKWNALDG